MDDSICNLVDRILDGQNPMVPAVIVDSVKSELVNRGALLPNKRFENYYLATTHLTYRVIGSNDGNEESYQVDWYEDTTNPKTWTIK